MGAARDGAATTAVGASAAATTSAARDGAATTAVGAFAATTTGAARDGAVTTAVGACARRHEPRNTARRLTLFKN